ncbi:hypothetical protein [Aquiflexum sp.]|uniref:hypothetical protein n=1 Tax=Aquiflexum sp. TaxID=1872584 RepID=UPI0035931ABE
MGISSLWKKVKESPSFTPTQFVVIAENIDQKSGLGQPIEKDQHYFMVRVNEMFLSYQRKWFSTYDPVVFSTAEYLYGGQRVSQPFLISPNMLQSPFKKLNEGFLFKDTTIAGLQPYRGGFFGLSLVLGRLKQDNYLRKLLSLLENTAAAFPTGFSTVITGYSKIANIVLDSVEAMFDSHEIEPVIGMRQEYVPAVQDNFTSGYRVLINALEGKFDPSKFFVKNNSLFYGNSIDESQPYRENDYILYSILKTSYRDDIDILPFHHQYMELQKLISGMFELSAEERKLINGKLFSLQDNIRMSPDLIRPQIIEQINTYRQDLKQMIDSRQPLSGSKGLKEEKQDEWEKEMDSLGLELLNQIN